MNDLSLEQEIDRLYALPLAEFIAARNEVAKRLKAAGDREAADEIKALAKPSVTAWAVNALYHHERQGFDELLAAAGEVRAALAGKGDRKKAEAARRAAVRALLARAAKILAGAGHAATPASRQRVSHTLETLAARDPATAGPLADERREAARRKLWELETALVELEREADAAEAAAAEAKARQEEQIEEAVEAARIAAAADKAAKVAKQDLAAATAAATQAKAARRKGLTRVAAAKRQLARLEA